MSKKLYLPNSTDCFVCGEDNTSGLGLHFYAKEGETKVFININIDEHFNSYKNIVHGGIISALLDESMGWAAFLFSDTKQFLFTRTLEITYRKNMPPLTDLLVTSEFVSMNRGLAITKGVISGVNTKEIYATAKGLFCPTSQEKMNETLNYLKFKDNFEYHPKTILYCKQQNINC